MSEPERMLDGGKKPTAALVAEWVGARSFKRWTDLREFIEAKYPGVFHVDWLFGGKKHGWALRFKKSKSFCTFVPERGRFKLLLVFGAAEREQVEAILPSLVSHVRDDYEKATTYHDGKWVFDESALPRLIPVVHGGAAPPSIMSQIRGPGIRRIVRVRSGPRGPDPRSHARPGNRCTPDTGARGCCQSTPAPGEIVCETGLPS